MSRSPRSSRGFTYGDHSGPLDDVAPRLPPTRHGRAAGGLGPRRLRNRRPEPGRRAAAGGGATDAATYWYLSGQPGESVRTGALDRFNQANPDTQDRPARPSRTTPTRPRSRRRSAPARPRRSSGAGAAAACSSYVEAGQVEDLTAVVRARTPAVKRPAVRRRRSAAATVDGKIYAMPAETVQPIVLYYNKKVFDKVGAQPPTVVGRGHGPGPEVQRGRHRAVLPRRAVPLDEHDVAGVPLRPHRRPRRVPRRRSTARRTPGRNPAVHRRPHQGAGPGQGQGLHQGLLVDHRRLQRRPGAALHRQGRDDAARLLVLRHRWPRQRRRLRLRRPPGLHELPAGRGRQGRPERHRRQPGPVPVDLVEGDATRRRTSAKKFFATAVLTDAEVQDWIKHRRRADRERQPTASSAPRRTPTSSSSSTTWPARPRSSPSPGTRR